MKGCCSISGLMEEKNIKCSGTMTRKYYKNSERIKENKML